MKQKKERIENTIWTMAALAVGVGIISVMWLFVSLFVIVFEG